MTQQEIQHEFILKLLKIVNTCDKDLEAAYKKRNKALVVLNDWAVEAWEEATDDPT